MVHVHLAGSGLAARIHRPQECHMRISCTHFAVYWNMNARVDGFSCIWSSSMSAIVYVSRDGRDEC